MTRSLRYCRSLIFGYRRSLLIAFTLTFVSMGEECDYLIEVREGNAGRVGIVAPVRDRHVVFMFAVCAVGYRSSSKG